MQTYPVGQREDVLGELAALHFQGEVRVTRGKSRLYTMVTRPLPPPREADLGTNHGSEGLPLLPLCEQPASSNLPRAVDRGVPEARTQSGSMVITIN